jgi:hypothetical protein
MSASGKQRTWNKKGTKRKQSNNKGAKNIEMKQGKRKQNWVRKK